MVTPSVKLALIDDHRIFRHALAHALATRGFEVVVQSSDARAAFAAIDKVDPDIVLLDLNLPAMDGITAIGELRSRSRQRKIFVLTASANQHDINAAMLAGVNGYATKEIDLAELSSALQRISAGENFLQTGLSVGSSTDPLGALSVRERDVFRLIARGLTATATAAQLCISVKTVDTHRSRIMKKLNIHSAAALIHFAATNGLIAR